MSLYEEVPVLGAGKRLGLRWIPWVGDWFNSWSPRNDNSNAEGEWDQWVDFAIKVLQDPLTKLVRPDAAEAVKDLAPVNFYTGASRLLTKEELDARFPEETR